MKIVELYKIITADVTYYWNSSDEDIDYLGDTYTPVAISRTNMAQTEEMSKNNLSLTVPYDNQLAILFLEDTTDLYPTMTIFQKQDSTVLTWWKGRIVNAKANDGSVALECESVFTSMRRPGLRAKYQRPCRHALYHRGCNLDKADFEVVATCTAASGVTLTVTEAGLLADGYYLGGMIRYNGKYRFILNHVGTTLTISRPHQDLNSDIALGNVSVSIYPGCLRTRDVCNDKFNNLVNFGGFPWIPTNNPFRLSSIV